MSRLFAMPFIVVLSNRYVWICNVVVQTIKQLLKTKRTDNCDWLVHEFIHPRTTEGTRMCVQLALTVTNLVEHRIRITASKLSKTKVSS